MDEHGEAVAARVRAARLAFREAVAAGCSYAVRRAMDEWEDALRWARASGIEVPFWGAEQASEASSEGVVGDAGSAIPGEG